MLKLRQVRLTKFDNCQSYVIKRVGLNEIVLSSYEDMLGSNDFKVRDYSATITLNQGDILIWDKNKEMVDMPTFIDEVGLIISRPTSTRIHMAVFEGDDRVTDCVRSNTPNKLPKIQMRMLWNISRKPDKILTYKL